MMRAPATGARPRALRAVAAAVAAGERHERGGRVLRARLAEVAGQQPEQLLQVAAQRRVPVHLDAEVLEDGDARRPRRCGGPSRAAAPRRRRTPPRSRRRRRSAKAASISASPVGVLGQPRPGDQVLLHEHRHQRGQAPRVGARPARPGGSRRARPSRCGAGSMTISARCGIVGDLLQRRCGRGGCRATATGSCRRTARPRRARSRRGPSCRACWALTQNSPVFSWASAFDR